MESPVAPSGTVVEEVVEPRYRKLSRHRAVILVSIAVVCLAAVALLALLVTEDRSPLGAFDQLGRRAENWADDHDELISVLRVIEVTFATVGMIVWTALVVVAVATRRRYRAAIFAVLVMVVASLTTTLVKSHLGRDRPVWQDTVDTLTSKSFPSGHASASAALAGILIVLAWSFLRRRAYQLAVTVLAVALWVTVCLDRVLLGRHYPTDVVAGSFLGAAVVLLGIVVCDPARMRLPDPED
jgi:membrane-associated phospholipid phosphatase